MCTTYGSHKSHEHGLAVDVASKAKAEVLTAVQVAVLKKPCCLSFPKKLDTIQANVEILRARVSDTKLNMNTSTTAARNLLAASQQEILNAINLRFTTLLQQLEGKYQQNQATLQQCSEEIANYLSLVAVLKEEASITCSGSLNRLLCTKGELLSRIEVLDLTKLPYIEELNVVVDVGWAAIVNTINTFGRIGVEPPTLISASSQVVAWSAVDKALEYQVKVLGDSDVLYLF